MPQKSRAYPQVEVSLHQALRMFHGRSFKSRVARCNMSNTTAAYMLNQYHSSNSPVLTFYRLFHMFSIHVWPPTFSQSESGWLAPPPMHYPCCLSEGFSHLCVTSNLQSLAHRRATCRLHASRFERYNSTPRPRCQSAGTLTRAIRMDAAHL